MLSPRIEVPPGIVPIVSRPYRMNPAFSRQVDSTPDLYLVAGLIEHPSSECSSPLIVGPMYDGTIRIMVNCKQLNTVSVVQNCPLPRIDEALESPGKVRSSRGGTSAYDFTR